MLMSIKKKKKMFFKKEKAFIYNLRKSKGSYKDKDRLFKGKRQNYQIFQLESLNKQYMISDIQLEKQL